MTSPNIRNHKPPKAPTLKQKGLDERNDHDDDNETEHPLDRHHPFSSFAGCAVVTCSSLAICAQTVAKAEE